MLTKRVIPCLDVKDGRVVKGRIEQRSVDASLEPCERVSAAIGFALFDSSIDRGADDVFVRADSAMYEHKTAMKAGRQ